MPFFRTLEEMRRVKKESPPLTSMTQNENRCVCRYNEPIVSHMIPTSAVPVQLYPQFVPQPPPFIATGVHHSNFFKAGCSPMACEYAPWYCPAYKPLSDWCALCLNRRLFPERCAPDPH